MRNQCVLPNKSLRVSGDKLPACGGGTSLHTLCTPAPASVRRYRSFETSTTSNHRAISPSLRHLTGKTDSKNRSRQEGRVSLLMVEEEYASSKPTEMLAGECNVWDEVIDRIGKRVPRVKGGRKVERFISAWPTADGAWPELPSNLETINTILAAFGFGQGAADPLRKYIDSDCLVTDSERFVAIMQPSMSARLNAT